MNETIKTQETEPNKIIIEVMDNFLSELYKKVGVNQDQDSDDSTEDLDLDWSHGWIKSYSPTARLASISLTFIELISIISSSVHPQSVIKFVR